MALDSPTSVSFLGNQKLETNCQLNGSSGIDFSALSEIAGENSDRAGHLHLSRPETSSAAGTVIVDSYPISEVCANLSAAKIAPPHAAQGCGMVHTSGTSRTTNLSGSRE
jgi:hypothetical protein